jgi:ubiquinone/menaquinone biosynthesis C-methylase UbiE
MFSKKNNKKLASSDTSWDKVSLWYDELVESGEGTYQKDLILPNLLRLLDLKKDQKILDLACGQGFFSREFAKTGASVLGVDLSKNLIDIARKNSPREIAYEVSPADKLQFLDNGSVDLIACISAIQNMSNVPEVLAECARVMKVGSRMVIVMNHPTFRIPKRSSWGYDEDLKIQFRRLDEYISESKSDIVAHPGSAPEISTPSFHHPLQFYFKAFHKAGLVVSRLEEWTSNKTSEPGARASAENKARKEFPMFLMIEVKKA